MRNYNTVGCIYNYNYLKVWYKLTADIYAQSQGHKLMTACLQIIQNEHVPVLSICFTQIKVIEISGLTVCE